MRRLDRNVRRETYTGHPVLRKTFLPIQGDEEDPRAKPQQKGDTGDGLFAIPGLRAILRKATKAEDIQ